MERIITEHEIKGEYKFIREITTTYFTTSDGVEHKGNTHRHPQHVPGTLEGDTYVKNKTTSLSADVKALATHFHTPEVHTGYEAYLVALAAEAAL